MSSPKPPTRVEEQLGSVAALDADDPVLAVGAVVNVNLWAVVLWGAVSRGHCLQAAGKRVGGTK